MKNYQHKDLANGRWNELDLVEQMANIGSEVSRAINWREKKNEKYAMQAFERALELFDLTIDCPKNRYRLKEVLRAREFFADYFVGENQYSFTKESWIKYFDFFAAYANKIRNEKMKNE